MLTEDEYHKQLAVEKDIINRNFFSSADLDFVTRQEILQALINPSHPAILAGAPPVYKISPPQ